MMAHGAFEVFKNAPKKPLIIGVDGLPGGMAGMQFVRDRSLIATMLYPTGGEEAIQMAYKSAERGRIQKRKPAANYRY